jgi:hypothetical protein
MFRSDQSTSGDEIARAFPKPDIGPKRQRGLRLSHVISEDEAPATTLVITQSGSGVSKTAAALVRSAAAI